MFDEGHTVDLVYINFAKAFESVKHQFLLAKLKSSGINGAVLNWIKSTASFLRRLLVLVASPKVQLLAHNVFCYKY